MASTALRLRRALSFSSALLARSTTSPSANATVCRAPILPCPPFSSAPPPTTSSLAVIGSRGVHTTSLSLSASRPYNQGDDQIDENTILFEGCDYKHWLIVMDFPKDPRPSPEEMVETYVQTLAKVVGSVEEAKKRMYACSTTTYTGFQAEMDEEVSKKFEDMPGVVFVLPDSYIDPVNKEYGGDKYINGTIIPRPPPVQYGRPRRQRVPSQDQQGYPEQGRMQRDGQNFRPQPNFQQQNYPPPGQQQRNYPPRDNFGPTQNYPPQQNYGPPPQNYPPPQQNYGPPQPNYGPPQPNYGPPRQNFAPPRQRESMETTPPYNQGSGYPPRNQRYSAESQQDFGPPSSSGGAQYEQGDRGSYGLNQTGDNNQGGYAPRGEDRQFNPRVMIMDRRQL
ncbi:hypothetical protein V2J09_021462 [Rumex salicifolius]